MLPGFPNHRSIISEFERFLPASTSAFRVHANSAAFGGMSVPLAERILERNLVCDSEEIAAVRFGESPVSFGNLGCNGKRGSVELIGKESVAMWKVLGRYADLIGEIYRFLVYKEFFECHGAGSHHGTEMRGQKRRKAKKSFVEDRSRQTVLTLIEHFFSVYSLLTAAYFIAAS